MKFMLKSSSSLGEVHAPILSRHNGIPPAPTAPPIGTRAAQDYITARVAGFLGIDLTALDPDGVGEEGGMFRLNVFGAALPTLFGVWWVAGQRWGA